MFVKLCPPNAGTAGGDAVSRCQVLGRAGSVHRGLPDATVTCFLFVGKSPLLDPEFLRASNICLDRSSYNGPYNKNG